MTTTPAAADQAVPAPIPGSEDLLVARNLRKSFGSVQALKDGSVTVRNGLVGRPDILITADSDGLLGLSSVPLRFGLPDATTKEGREVTVKLLRRELKVKGLLLHPLKLARLNKLLSVA